MVVAIQIKMSHVFPGFECSYLTYGLVGKDIHLMVLIEYHYYELR